MPATSFLPLRVCARVIFVAAGILVFAAFFVGANIFAQVGPSVSVSSPNGGQCYTVGQNIHIMFTRSGGDHAWIGYTTDNGASRTVIQHPYATDMYDWPAPSTLAGTPFKIVVEVHDPSTIHTKVAEDFSDTVLGISSTTCTTGTVPAAPSNLRLDPAPTASTIYLMWNDNSTNEDKFNLERSAAGANSWTLVIQTGANITSHADITVAASTNYDYRVQACLSGSGCSAYYTLNNVSTTSTSSGDITLPGVPSGLSVFSTSSSSVTLQWTAPGDDGTTGTVSGYEVRMSANPLGTMTADQWWSQAGLAPNVTFDPAAFAAPGGIQKATVGSLASSTTNYFGVKARDEVPNWSPVASPGPIAATTTTGTSATDNISPAAIVLSVGSITSTGAFITWIAPGDDDFTGTASSYELRYSTAVPGADLNVWWSGATLYSCSLYPVPAPVAGGPGVQQSMTVGCLQANTNYYFGMRAKDEVPNVSSLTSTLSVLTPAGIDTSLATLSGKVKKSDGTGVASAWINIWTKTGTYSSYSAQSGTDGSYTISGITPATYTATVNPPFESGFFAPPDVSLTFTAGESKLYDFTLQIPPKIISGKVSLASGTAVTDANVNVWRDCPSSTTTCAGGGAWTTVDALGNYSVKVTGGSWRVSIYPKDYLTATWTWSGEAVLVSFLNDESLESKIANFTVESTAGYASLNGKVTNGSGKAVSGAQISLWSSDSTTSTTTTVAPKSSNYYSAQSNADGTYQIQNIKPGTYRAVAWPPYGSTDLMQSLEVALTFVEKEAKAYDFKLITGTKIISGSVKDTAGKAITDANVSAYQEGGTGWVQTPTDAAGLYTLKVTGGNWRVSVYPKDWQTAKWSWNKEGVFVSFALDSTAETRTVDFIVTAINSTVKGKIAMPDGSAPPHDTVWVNLKDAAGMWFGGGQLGPDGSFSINVGAGTYTLEIYTQDQSFYAPTQSAISVAEGATVDLGTIKLIKKSEKIVGKVSDASGAAVAGANVSAWLKDATVAGGYAWATTSSTGTYELFVFPGTWSVSVYAYDPATGNQQQYANLPPKDAIVAQGATVTLDFVLTKADAVISGTVTDCCGNFLADATGWINASSAQGYGAASSWFGGEIKNGVFSLNVTPGTWQLSVYFPPGSKYLGADPLTVTVESGKTAAVIVKALTANAAIEGFAKDASGKVVTNVDVSVYASCVVAGGNCVWTSTVVDPKTGFYQLKVSAGSWNVGYWVMYSESGWVLPPETQKTIDIKSGETKRLDITLTKADAKITGKASKPDGTGMANVWVSADSWSSGVYFKETAAFQVVPVSYGGQTDASGNFSISVPQGAYYMHAFGWYQSDLLPPDEVSVSINSGETKTANLVFKQPDVTVKGRTLKDGKDPVKAWIWTWPEGGNGGASQESDTFGNYELKISGGQKWHIGAGAQIGSEYYNSGESVIEPKAGETITLDIVLVSISVMPPPATKTTCASCTTTLALADGATCSVPANAARTEGNITVGFEPDASVPSSIGTYTVMGVGYKVVVRDDVGNIVSDLNSAATVCLPFDSAEVKAQGVDPSRLKLAWYDETAGAWKTLDEQVVDPENGKVCGSITHLTRFAIVAPADVTPPVAPSSISANAGASSITLSWANPQVDFHSARIYRSGVAGSLGELVASSIKDASYLDTGLQNGVTYYYTVRAIDLAGNESVNVAQVSATPGVAAVVTQTAAAPTGQLPSGSLFRIKDQMTVWFAEKGQRRGIPSLAVFEANGFAWSEVRVIDSASHLDFYAEGSPERFPEGTVLKGSAPAVYVVTDRNKLPFSSAEAFLGLGYSWDEILNVSDEELALHDTGTEISSTARHPNGSLVKAADDFTVWFIEQGHRRGIPNPQVFESRRFSWNTIRTISEEEMALYPVDVVLGPADFILVKSDAPQVYFIEDGKRRHIESAEAFVARGFDWGKIVQFAKDLVDLIPEGLSIR